MSKFWHRFIILQGDLPTGIVVTKPTAISVLMDEEDVQIEFDRLEHEDFVQEKARKLLRAERRERDALYEKGVKLA